MADVLIKGMKMPAYCAECDLHDPFTENPYCRRLMKKIPLKGRLKNCPLVEVPTHGRLIDADELYKLIDGGYDLDFDEDPETKRELLRMINERETVIEASEDGEQNG